MKTRFIIRLFVFLLLSVPHSRSLAQTYLDVPVGRWVAEQSLDNRDLPSVIWSYSSGFVLFSTTNGENTQYQFSGAAYVWPDSIDRVDDDVPFKVTKLGADQIQIQASGSQIVYQNKPQIYRKDLNSFVGEWNTTEAPFKIYIYGDGTVLAVTDDSLSSGSLILDGAGAVVKLDEIEPAYIPILKKKNSSFEVPLDNGESLYFFKMNSHPPKKAIMDSNGNPMQIDALSIDVSVHGPFIETALELAFTNVSENSEEAFFELPIPAATVIGYSLDVKGVMVPAVAVPKDVARETFEALEAKGVDPAIAEISRNNQFKTEIYPISKGQQRRITVTYIEKATSAKVGKSRYEFPLTEFGFIDNLRLQVSVGGLANIELVSFPPELKAVDSKAGAIINAATLNYQSSDIAPSSNIAIEFEQSDGDIFITADDKEAFFVIDLAQGEIPRLDNSPDEMFIAWDVSLSMQPDHQDYVLLVQKLINHFPNCNFYIQPFSITLSDPIMVNRGMGEVKLKEIFAQFRYDGASRLGLIKSLPFSEKQKNLLFTDGVATFGALEAHESSPSIIAIHPASAPVNSPFLRQVSKKGGVFSLGQKDNAQYIVDAIMMTDFEIQVEENKNIVGLVVSQSLEGDSRVTISGKVPLNELPQKLNIQFRSGIREVLLKKDRVVEGKLARYMWVNQMLQPLLAFPRVNKKEIERLGMEYSMATPYTSLISLESLDDYVEYGIRPPSIMDLDGQYHKLRSEYVEEENLDEPDRLEALVEGWSDRVDWWRHPVEKSGVWKRVLKFLGIEPSSNLPVDSLEEVIVTGIRASETFSPIIIEAWDPSQPYLDAIKISQTPLEEYYNQRVTYGKSPAFYMDVSKYFFKEGKDDDAVRVLTNILELLPERLSLERMVAYILLENGVNQDALELFSYIDEIVPYQANAKRDLAIAWEHIAVKDGDSKALDKAAMYYYRSAMDSEDDVDGLPLTSIMELNRLLAQHKGKVKSKKSIDSRLLKNLPLDLRVVLTWSSNLVDLDLHVIEPSGEEVYYSNRKSKQGGYLPYDDVTGFGPEEYLF